MTEEQVIYLPVDLHPPTFPTNDYVPELERKWLGRAAIRAVRNKKHRAVIRVHRELQHHCWDMLGGRCWYCGELTPEAITRDHKVPLSRGGSNERENLVPACDGCNRRKGSLLAYVFLNQLRQLLDPRFAAARRRLELLEPVADTRFPPQKPGC